MAAAASGEARPPRRPLFHLPIRLVKGRPRLFLCALAGAVVGLLTPASWEVTVRCLVGWNIAVLLHFITAGAMMSRADGEALKRRARETDEGRFGILIAGIAAAAISLGAIVVELGIAKDLQGPDRTLHVALAGVTVVLSWFFLHFLFALHYANEFFLEEDTDGDGEPELRGGLHFPHTKEPVYVDFLYYAYTIGVAAQTADVETTSRDMRVVTLSQSIVAFFFNTAILALAINIAAGLI